MTKEFVPYIIKHLEASSAHIAYNDDHLLHSICNHLTESLLSIDSTTYGYTIYIDEDIREMKSDLNTEGFSNEFYNLLILSQEHECIYLTIDCDGHIYDTLPTFDW